MSYTVTEHERQLLGIAIAHPEKLATIELSAQAFGDPRHRAIYVGLLDCYYGGEPITVGSICASLEGIDRAYLGRLLVDAEPTGNIAYHAAEIEKHYRRRQAEGEIRRMVEGLGRGEDPVSLLAQAADVAAGLATADEPRFPVITSAELARSNYTIDYLINGIIVRGQPHGWGGPAKGMKTSTAVDAAISLACGGHFLGYWPAKQAEGVLFLSGESGLPTLKETAERICAAANRNLADLDRLHWCTSIPRLGDDGDIRALQAVLRRTKSDVLFVDPLYLCLAEEADGAGNMYKMGPLLRKLSSMTSSIGVTPIVLHHTTRAAGKEIGEPLELSAFAWAGFSEWIRAWVLINRQERYEDGSGLHRLWLVAGGSAGHSGCWSVTIDEGRRSDIGGRVWRTQVMPREAARQDDEQRKSEERQQRERELAEQRIERLLAAARQFANGATRRELKDATGLRSDHFSDALDAALDRGLLARCQVPKANKQVYDGFKLAHWGTTGERLGNGAGSSVGNHTGEQQPLIGAVPSSPLMNTDSRPLSGEQERVPRFPSGSADDPIVFAGSE